MKIKILYIDDEINNLTGFKATFRMDYNILIAHNTIQAYDLLVRNPDIRVIFCDQRMPDKTGVEFFQEIKNQFPHPIRILLTGYTDIEAVINSINHGNIFRYVQKPWSEADIVAALNEANKFYMLNSMLSIKNGELKKAYIELDKFAHSVTHDMRRPLLGILGAIEVAQEIDDIGELKSMLNMMQESVKNLDDFVQSTHDYYSLKRGELIIEEIDFQELIKKEEESLKSKITEDIRFRANLQLEETFRCDKASMNIILHNLLTNAFKYQKKGNEDKFVELDIKVATGMATISIRDNGIGIPENDINDIFNMFFRSASEESGSGFGLYNVKDALLKLNGNIQVDSQVDVGSTFKVTIQNK
ncbi:MAG: Hydrogenase transcriptional regulatory protein hupR1 [Daejeonella sp.]|nr:Hydrogenase transcriptional regulatory protein hupR1 [Daejeonella sp.]